MAEASQDRGGPTAAAVPGDPRIDVSLEAPAALAYRTPLQDHQYSADNKAMAVLTLVGLVFTILGRHAGQVSEVVRSDSPWQRVAALALLGGLTVFSLATLVQAFRTIAPRFPKSRPCLAFFADMARLGRDEYIRQVEALSATAAVEQMLIYNHTVAGICADKHRHLRYAFHLFQAAGACWVLLMALLGWRMLSMAAPAAGG